MNRKIKLAFTLIELLVVIAIIGILSGLIVVSMNGSINSANDAKRKASIDTIRKALVIYRTLNGNIYPTESTLCNIGPVGTTNRCTTLATALSELLPTLPVDPVSGYYTYISTGSSFTVSALLSNSSFYNYSSSAGFTNATAQIFTTVGTINWAAPGGCSSAEVLVVGGGGGTGYDVGGGGGGGGVVYAATYPLNIGSYYTVTVGAGGASGQSVNVKGSNGGNSVFGTITALGGGGGGAYVDNGLGLNGGSGGGGGDDSFAGGSATQGSSGGYPGYGYPGGSSSTPWGSGGGGGAGGPGSNGITGTVVNGGPGLVYSISGSSVEYGRGGNGNSDGGTISVTPANVGQGAMGTGAPNASPYSGGSGVVIVRCK